MRTLRLLLAGAVSLALLGGITAGVVAQPEAEAPGSDESTLLSFTLPYHPPTEAPAVLFDDGRTLRQRFSFQGAIDSGDPRLSGKLWAVLDHDTYSDSQGSVFVGIVGIDNDDGAWRGTSRGYSTPNNERVYDQLLLTGEDAYEGLSAILFLMDNGTDGMSRAWSSPASCPRCPSQLPSDPARAASAGWCWEDGRLAGPLSP